MTEATLPSLTCVRCGEQIADTGKRWDTAGRLLAHMDEMHTPHLVTTSIHSSTDRSES